MCFVLFAFAGSLTTPSDLWGMIWEFMRAFPKDLSSYDPGDSAWPLKIDEFTEWMEKGDD